MVLTTGVPTRSTLAVPVGCDAVTLEEFRGTVAEVAGLEPADVDPDDFLVDDLGLDSQRLVELAAALAQRGIDVPEDLALEATTVGDAYRRCVAAAPHRPGASPVATGRDGSELQSDQEPS